MRKDQVVLGGVYEVKVAGRLARVRIRGPHWSGVGWDAVTLDTGREIRVRTGARLRRELERPRVAENPLLESPPVLGLSREDL